MGRKRTLVTRNEYISFRVSSLEKKAIELAAKEVCLPVSEFSRRAVLNQNVVVRFSEEEVQIYKDLHKFHTNFSRIASLVKSYDLNDKAMLIGDIREVQKLIKEHLARFKK